MGLGVLWVSEERREELGLLGEAEREVGAGQGGGRGMAALPAAEGQGYPSRGKGVTVCMSCGPGTWRRAAPSTSCTLFSPKCP